MSAEQSPPPVTPPAETPAQAPAKERSQGGATSVATPPAPAKNPPSHQPLDQYKVLLHNDDHNEMMYVVRSLVEIAHLPTHSALKTMLETHKTGVGLVTVTHRELAELYSEQFQSKGLTTTIEKA